MLEVIALIVALSALSLSLLNFVSRKKKKIAKTGVTHLTREHDIKVLEREAE